MICEKISSEKDICNPSIPNDFEAGCVKERSMQNVEGTESARARGKEKTESERREREVVRTRGWREE